jgi:phenylacetate-CoA ligase
MVRVNLMLPEVLDRALRTFEHRVARPKTVKRVARLLAKLGNRGPDAGTVRQIQRLRLRQTMHYVYEHSPFYREKFEDYGIRPGQVRELADLQNLPFTTSDDIRDARRFLCVPEDELRAVFTTSGSTGEPKRVYYTWRDTQMLTNLAAVLLRVGRPGRLWALIALPMAHGLWIGAPSAARTVERAGGLPIPVGTGDPAETLRWMRRFQPDVVLSCPSYMTALTREAEREGYRFQLDQILLSGEMLPPDHKRYFHAYWGASISDAYGATEIGGAQAIAQPACTAFSLNDLHLATEIVDPATRQPADEGELVFTTLGREAMPLVRYRSGDRARWADCACGLPVGTMQLLGRVDDMLVAGDMNLFGQVIADRIAQAPGATGRVELVLTKVELTDRLRLRVEGQGVDPEGVRRALYDAYPELPANIQNGNLIFEIETGVDLGAQIKALKIVDRRARS